MRSSCWIPNATRRAKQFERFFPTPRFTLDTTRLRPPRRLTIVSPPGYYLHQFFTMYRPLSVRPILLRRPPPLPGRMMR
jgi:hypothetical protein